MSPARYAGILNIRSSFILMKECLIWTFPKEESYTPKVREASTSSSR